MIKCHRALYLLGLSSVVSAASLPQIRTADILTLPSSNIEALTSTPAGHANISAGSKLRISCDAPTYGQNLKVKSCKKIFEIIAKDENQIVFGDRATLAPHDLPLPYRLQSTDGTCFIELVLGPEVQTGHISSLEFGQAAYTMFKECVVKYGYGGVASDMGGDNNLKAVISTYKPHFTCSQSLAPPWRSTVHVFAGMFATRRRQVFGGQGVAGVDIELPFEWNSPDSRAKLIVSSDGRTAISSWFEIWEAVNTIAYTCVKSKKKGGKSTRIGSLGNIEATLFDAHPEMDELVADGQDDSFSGTFTIPAVSVGNDSIAKDPLLLPSNVTIIPAGNDSAPSDPNLDPDVTTS